MSREAGMEELVAALMSGDAETAVSLARGQPGLLEERTPQGVTPILLALYLGHRDLSAALIRLKPALNLYEAAAAGLRDRMAELAAADPSHIDRPAPDGFTALGLACLFGREDAAEWLLRQGADPNRPSANALAVRPLHSAMASGRAAIVRALLKHGADPDMRQPDGSTALHMAAKHGQAELAFLLLSHGASPDLANDLGDTPIDLADRGRHAEISAMLEAAWRVDDGRPFGLISAMPEEIGHFGPYFEEMDVETVAGFTFRHGRLDGRAVVVVEAGIGKVNAALVATLLLERFDCRALIFSGVAGGIDPALGIGDVVVATRLIQHDYGALVGGQIRTYQPGVPPLPGVNDAHGYDLEPDLAARARAMLEGMELEPLPEMVTGGAARRPSIHFGTVLTGDQFLNCAATRERLFTRFGAKAVEMEGAAIAQVAARYDVPALVVRSLSDLAGEESHMDFPAFVQAAAATAAYLVRRLAAVV